MYDFSSPRVGRYRTTVAINVRAGAGINQRQLTVRELTPNGRQNATSTNLNTLATFRTGTIVDVLEVKQVGKDWWGRVPSGWIALRFSEQDFVAKI